MLRTTAQVFDEGLCIIGDADFEDRSGPAGDAEQEAGGRRAAARQGKDGLEAGFMDRLDEARNVSVHVNR